MKAKEMVLFTNGSVFIKNELGEQMSEYQKVVNCYEIDTKKALEATLQADDFYISKFGEWAHRIDRKEMQHLLRLVK